MSKVVTCLQGYTANRSKGLVSRGQCGSGLNKRVGNCGRGFVGQGVSYIGQHSLAGRGHLAWQQGWRRVDAPGNATIGSHLETGQSSRQGEPQVEPSVDTEETAKRRFHIATYLILLTMGLIAAATSLFLTSNIRFESAIQYLFKKLVKSVAARQALGIVFVMLFVRSGLTPVVKLIRGCFRLKNPWETSTEAYLLKEVYQPLELLLGVAAFATLAENILPPLISVPKQVIHEVLRTVLSLAFIFSASRVGFTFKQRILQEAKWKMELNGTTSQIRNIEAVDKLSTAGIVLVTLLLALQSVGLDIHSLLAIGGIGGIAIGLAGREIFENVFSGFMIMGARPFDVGDEVTFYPGGKLLEGIVVDIGWYHTSIRSFEREMYAIPNSVFSKEVVLNITRKGKEWRYIRSLPVRVSDINKVEAIVSDIRRIVRQDERVIQRLYRRVFLGDISEDCVTIYIAFYMEMINRDAFLAARQQMTLAFIDCIERNGAKLAERKMKVDVLNENKQDSLLPVPGEVVEMSDTEVASPLESNSMVAIPVEKTDLANGMKLDSNTLNHTHSSFISPNLDGTHL